MSFILSVSIKLIMVRIVMLSVTIMPIIPSVSIKYNILSVVMMNVTIKPIILSDIYTVCLN